MVFFSDQDGKQGIYNCWPYINAIYRPIAIQSFSYHAQLGTNYSSYYLEWLSTYN